MEKLKRALGSFLVPLLSILLAFVIGGIIMTHGDNNGLVLPPEIAPIQVIVVPVAQHKPGVTEKATELYETIKAAGVRVKIDVSDNSLGWQEVWWGCLSLLSLSVKVMPNCSAKPVPK